MFEKKEISMRSYVNEINKRKIANKYKLIKINLIKFENYI